MIEIENNSETISAEIKVGATDATPFFGWLELIEWLGRAASVDTTPARDRGGS
ncbi:MAG TPA: hypothetical protein VGY32_02515 [Solirubrobacteraceae bacterium]|jgi:hypothetical protein|nr:hypothetical protein [Solirubrobacteraceae bacterium]